MLKYSMDPEKQAVIITITSGLIDRYYSNLEGLVLLKKDTLPTGITISRSGLSSATLSIPAMPTTVREGVGLVTMDKSQVDNLNSLLNSFIHKASKSEMKTTEYIPLTGYSINSLKEEIKSAITEKRNLAIVKSYKEYNSLINSAENIERVFFEYGTDEYFDAVLFVAEGDLKSLKKMTSGKFTRLNWWGPEEKE